MKFSNYQAQIMVTAKEDNFYFLYGIVENLEVTFKDKYQILFKNINICYAINCNFYGVMEYENERDGEKMKKSISINIFLIDGTPTGRIKSTMQNWTGVGYKVPRNLLRECDQFGGDIQEHLKQSGIYFLLGEDNEGNPCIYIGQAILRKNGNGLLARLKEHNKKTNEIYCNYWNEVICFTTTNNSFGATEISYLENKFTNLAKESNRYTILNGNEPNIGNVTEEKESELEEFIDKAKVIMGEPKMKVYHHFKSLTCLND